MGENKRIGIAFSGGGGRGFFHIGVIKAMEEIGVNVDIVAGTSAGSVAGLCLASGLKVDEFQESLPSNPVYNFKNLAPGKVGFTKLNTLEEFIAEFIPYRSLLELPVTFKPVCTNLDTSQPYAPEEGDIVTWVCASCAVPIVVQPVIIDGRHFLDGGLSCNLPARFIRDQCDILIGVNLFPETVWHSSTKASWRTIANRSVEITLQHNAQYDAKMCDLLISDPGIGNYKPYKYHKREELVKLGYEAAMELLPKLVEKVA